MDNQQIVGQQASNKANDYYWEDSCWVNPPFDAYRIIEFDVYTFTPEGTLPAAIRKLNQLKKIGINALVINPGTWLFDKTEKLFRLTEALSHEKALQLKQFINTCHFQGIAVSIDMTDVSSTLRDQSEQQSKVFIENALIWLRDFHVDAIRLENLQEWPRADRLLQKLRAAASQLTTRTGRQYYLLIHCETSPLSVIGRYIPQFSYLAKKAARFTATRVGLAKRNEAFQSRTYRRDYLYDRRFADALRTFFSRSV